jgi:biopolymer transport protein ExbB
MAELFLKGGPIMWPLLATSLVAVAVVCERLWFLLSESRRRSAADVAAVFGSAEVGDFSQAASRANASGDFVARALGSALQHPGESFVNALLCAARQELRRFNRGLSTLDTIVTLAPLLGLLGTVTGMIRAFGLLGNRELDAPAAITGGIAQALIATAFGLAIAIVALIPFNYLNTRMEEARADLEDAATRMELLLTATSRPKEGS